MTVKLFAELDNEPLGGWLETSGFTTLEITDIAEAASLNITEPSLVKVVNGTVTETFATGQQAILDIPYETVLEIRKEIEG